MSTRAWPLAMLLALSMVSGGCGEGSPTSSSNPACAVALPAPVLEVGPRLTETAGAVHYQLFVRNWSVYADGLFAQSPDLPPCGLNSTSSRTWIEIHATGGVRLYGHCAIASAAGLQNQLSVPIPRSFPAPTGIFIEMIDRRCDRNVFSNVAPFTP